MAVSIGNNTDIPGIESTNYEFFKDIPDNTTVLITTILLFKKNIMIINDVSKISQLRELYLIRPSNLTWIGQDFIGRDFVVSNKKFILQNKKSDILPNMDIFKYAVTDNNQTQQSLISNTIRVSYDLNFINSMLSNKVIELPVNSTVKDLKDYIHSRCSNVEIHQVIIRSRERDNDYVLENNDNYFIIAFDRINTPRELFLKIMEKEEQNKENYWESIASINSNKILMTWSGNTSYKHLVNKWMQFTKEQQNEIQILLSNKFPGVRIFTIGVYYHEKSLEDFWFILAQNPNIYKSFPDIQLGFSYLLERITTSRISKDDKYMFSIMHILYNNIKKGEVEENEIDSDVMECYALYLSNLQVGGGKRYKLIKHEL